MANRIVQQLKSSVSFFTSQAAHLDAPAQLASKTAMVNSIVLQIKSLAALSMEDAAELTPQSGQVASQMT